MLSGQGLEAAFCLTRWSRSRQYITEEQRPLCQAARMEPDPGGGDLVGKEWGVGGQEPEPHVDYDQPVLVRKGKIRMDIKGLWGGKQIKTCMEIRMTSQNDFSDLSASH